MIRSFQSSLSPRFGATLFIERKGNGDCEIIDFLHRDENEDISPSKLGYKAYKTKYFTAITKVNMQNPDTDKLIIRLSRHAEMQDRDMLQVKDNFIEREIRSLSNASLLLLHQAIKSLRMIKTLLN